MLLVRPDDEDIAHRGIVGRGAAFRGAGRVGRQHAVKLGDFQVGVADHGIVGRHALGLLDVGGPFGRGCSTGSTDRPSTLTPRLSNSGFSLATAPSSVVQTGVKSLGCEKNSTQLSPAQS